MRFFRRLFRLTGAGFLLGLIALGILLVLTPFYVYEVFNQEFPIARLEFTRTGDLDYMARLSRGDFCTVERYPVRGDQFQLDAGFVKWKGPAVLLGFRPRYRLDRLAGRYGDTTLQNTRPASAHDLAPDMLFDFFSENARQSVDGWLIDTSYGSSVYYPIDPALRYTVYATEDGLVLRSVPIQEFTRDNGNLVIEITQGCGETGTTAREFFLRLNKALGASG